VTSLPRLAVGRPIGVAMCAIAVSAVGLLSATRLPIDLLPDLMYPELVVRAAYPGAAPSEVERAVTEPVERAVAGLAGLERTTSITRHGISVVTLRFAWGTRMDYAALGVRERLDEVRGALPSTVARPTVVRTDPSAAPVLTVVVSAADARASTTSSALDARPRLVALHQLGQLSDDLIRRRLEQLDGVAEATVVGAPDREIQVDADPVRLASLGLTLDDLAAALASANQSAPGGSVQRAGTRFALRTIGELTSVAEIGDVVVRPPHAALRPRAAGVSRVPGALRIGDVARVVDGFREPVSVARHDGRDAIVLLVRKTPSANAVQVARRAARVVDELRRAHPAVNVAIASSQATFVRGAIANVAQEVIVGGILAFVVLFLFLRDARVPASIGVVIPVSLLAACALLDAAGLSLNVMTLGGLALGVGLLMDNAIVVAESILRRRHALDGAVGARDAAIEGSAEVQAAVLTSTLTTIAVFAPVAYVAGIPGRLFGALALSIAFALGASALLALTVLPAMASRWTAGTTAQRGRSLRALAAFDRVFDAFAAWYERVLAIALDHRAWVVVLAAALFAATVAGGSALERTVLPVVDQGTFRVRLTLPPGTSLERTALAAARLDSALRRDANVASVLSRIGQDAESDETGERASGGAHVALLDVRVRDGTAIAPVVARLRATLASPALAEWRGHVVVEPSRSTALGALLGAHDADVAVRIRGDDPDAGRIYAHGLVASLAAAPSLVDVRVDGLDRQPEVQVRIDRERAAAHGAEPRRVAHAVEAAGLGVLATSFLAFDRAVPVRVREIGADRRALASLQGVMVGGVPLHALADVREAAGAAELRREDGARVTLVLADVARGPPGGLARAVGDVERALVRRPPPAGLRAEVGGRTDEVRRGLRGLALAFGLAVALVYLILAAEFESIVHPFTVLLSVPLASCGAVLALWATGTPLSAVSAIGLVVLVGIVDNDAVVKVDCIVRLRRAGMSARAAAMAAGRRRLRPIVINTVTALLGLLPMALGAGPGGELQAPLAIAVFGGLLSATALTLVVIPVVYTLLEDARDRMRR
jgi:HAE1 family hydrophobic/amphiphilic exporter-1